MGNRLAPNTHKCGLPRSGMTGDKVDVKSLQKTCHIFTVNLKHVDSKYDWSEMPEDEIIEELENHWADLVKFPNAVICRGQIERNKNGTLHINGAVKFSKVIRSRTLENKWGCWAEPARNEQAVLNYGKKLDTRVKPLPNKGEMKLKKDNLPTPKQEAVKMLMAGMTPKQICMVAPDVYFTHHRAINETFKMMCMMPVGHFDTPLEGLEGEEEMDKCKCTPIESCDPCHANNLHYGEEE